MANTRHGHHIEGTPVTESEAKLTKVRLCGGPGRCSECTREAWLVVHNQNNP